MNFARVRCITEEIVLKLLARVLWSQQYPSFRWKVPPINFSGSELLNTDWTDVDDNLVLDIN